jgi:hypothetical protein
MRLDKNQNFTYTNESMLQEQILVEAADWATLTHQEHTKAEKGQVSTRVYKS